MNRREFLALAAGMPWLSVSAADAPLAGVHVFGRLPQPDTVRRVFAAGAPAAVLVHALAPEKLLGWPWVLSAEALAMLAPAARSLPLLGRLAGRGSTMPLERLVVLAPDLIIDCGTVDANYLSVAERVHQQTGIAYVLIDGHLADSARQLRDAGHLLGVPARGEMLARHAQAALPACDAGRVPEASRVYLARAADGLETPLSGSVNAECIEAACASNVARGKGGLARVSLEQLLVWAPDAIVTQSAEFVARARQDASWQRVAAVRDGRLLLAPSLPFGWLDGPPGINRLLGVSWLHERLGKAQAVTDWIERAQDFHRVFYGHAPSRAQLARSLGGR